MLKSSSTSRLFCLVFACCLVLPVQAQDEQSKARFLNWLHEDAVGMVQDGTSLKTLGFAAGTAAMLIPLSSLDERIAPEVQVHAQSSFHSFLNTVNHLGGPKAIVPVAGIFAASLATDNSRFQDAAFTSLQSLVYAGAISYGLKYTVGRSRPHQDEGAHTFNPFSGNASFPSGHTTTAFAIVTPWVLYYPHPVTYGLFALSTGTAIARIARDAHWTTDVLAGAAIGFTTAYYLTKRHGGLSGDFIVTPIAAPGTAGLAILARF
jgi:membrane-associated phospholipid phosphatase